MNDRLSGRLRAGFPRYTKAEKAIATFMLANLRRLPFETAGSIGEAVGVSQMTVGRFLRTLGYGGLPDFKEALRQELEASPLLIADRMERLRRHATSNGLLSENLQLEIASLVALYELVGTSAWRETVRLLVESDAVRVAGFQTVAGLAADFAARLEYLRPEARYLDGRDGTFADLFARPEPARACLVLFEMRRYTKLSHQLARKATEQQVPLVIVCDTHCHWARDYTQTVLTVQTDSLLFWDSQAPFVSLLGLLLNDIILQQGERVAERTRRMTELQDSFGAFQD